LLTWQYSKEAPHHQSWKFGVTTKRNKQLGTNYFAPTLARGEATSESNRAEIRKLIDRQLLTVGAGS
jgi:hypothetical protein